jgi:hypothetical protein
MRFRNASLRPTKVLRDFVQPKRSVTSRTNALPPGPRAERSERLGAPARAAHGGREHAGRAPPHSRGGSQSSDAGSQSSDAGSQSSDAGSQSSDAGSQSSDAHFAH